MTTKTLKSLMAALAVLLSLNANAHDVEVNGIYYDVFTESRTAVVTKNYNSSYSGTVNIPLSITYNGVTYSVTSISDWAFSGCSDLTSVSIPNSVTSIGDQAFSGCRGLTAVDIPNSVTSIGACAFQNCSGLTAVTVASDNPKYDSRNNCNAIIETSSNKLVVGCKNTTIPNSVTSIGDWAFWGCSGLTTVNIPNSVTSIGDRAFSGCSSLTAVDIPNSVTSIGYAAFQYCYGLTAVDIPNSVTSIGACAFQNCMGLTAVDIPNSVTSIGYAAFLYCDGLTAVDIPNSVTSIGDAAFQYCYGLTAVSIPNSVTSIGDWAFGFCSGLMDMYCYAQEVPNTDSDAFNQSNIGNATLHVPAASVDNYKTTSPWNKFGNIVPISEKCATPTISFANGKVKVTCATEGAKCVTSIVMAENQTSEDGEIDVSPAFKVSTYAMAEGYEDSEVVTATFSWPKTAGDLNEDGHIDISDVTTLVNIILGK